MDTVSDSPNIHSNTFFTDRQEFGGDLFTSVIFYLYRDHLYEVYIK